MAVAVASGAAYVYKRQATEKIVKRAWGGAFACLLTATITGFVLYFFAWQRIPVLGMRALWPVWFVAHAIWGYFIWAQAQKAIPAERASRAKRQNYEKWLPKAKKRSA